MRINASHVSCNNQASNTEATVLAACGADDAEGLQAFAFLNEPLFSSNCTNVLTNESSSITYGGGTASYLTMGRFCKTPNNSASWELNTRQTSCLSGMQFATQLQQGQQKHCYSTGVCSAVKACQTDGSCSGNSSCEALPPDITMTLRPYNSSLCVTRVGQNAGTSKDMWPLASSKLTSSMSFLQGALSVALGSVSQDPNVRD